MPSLFIISGPSAVGKDDLINGLMDIDENVLRGRKVTTRKPRPGERKTGSYLFLTHAQFHKRLEAGELFQHYVKNEIWYAIDREFIVDEVASGYDVLLVFSMYDRIGQLQHSMQDTGINTKSILVLADLADLEERIRGRYEHSPEEIPTRMKTMKKDLKSVLHSQRTLTDYDYILQNPNSEAGIQPLIAQVSSIIEAERANLIANEERLDRVLGTYRPPKKKKK